jgi:hypothetical protein
MGGRGNSNPFGGGQEERGPSIQRVRRDVYDWIADPDGYATIKDDYMGSPGFDPSDPRWDEFVQFVVRQGWRGIPYPVMLPDGTIINDASDIPPYNDAKDKAALGIFFGVIFAIIWLLNG